LNGLFEVRLRLLLTLPPLRWTYGNPLKGPGADGGELD